MVKRGGGGGRTYNNQGGHHIGGASKKTKKANKKKKTDARNKRNNDLDVFDDGSDNGLDDGGEDTAMVVDLSKFGGGKKATKGGNADEEIDDDDAFTAEDYERYGDVGATSKHKKKGKHGSSGRRGGERYAASSTDEEEDEDEEDGAGIPEGMGMSLSDMLADDAGDDNDDDDNDDDEDDESDDANNERGHSAMLSSMGVSDGSSSASSSSSSARRRLGREVAAPLSSEQSYAHGQSDLKLADLLDPLASTSGFSSLTSKVATLTDDQHKSSRTLGVPLPEIREEELQRDIGFVTTRKEVSKWTPIVKTYREAEHVAYPLNAPPRQNVSSASLSTKFVPTNSLEQDLDNILTTSKAASGGGGGGVAGDGVSGEGALAAAEDRMLAEREFTMEEIQEKRAALAKMKNLMFFNELKAKRVKKIKSRSFRKIQKKLREKNALSDAELRRLDPEAAQEAAAKREYKRVKERMTARHKNTSKWAQRLKHRQHLDGSKELLQEQIRLGESLREKVDHVDEGERARRRAEALGEDEYDSTTSEDDDDEDDGADAVTRAKRVQQKYKQKLAKLKAKLLAGKDDDDEEDNDDGDGGKPTSGLFALKFMQRGMDKQKQQALALLDSVEDELGAMGAEDGSDDDDDSDDADGKKSKHKKAFALRKSQQKEHVNEKARLAQARRTIGGDNGGEDGKHASKRKRSKSGGDGADDNDEDVDVSMLPNSFQSVRAGMSHGTRISMSGPLSVNTSKTSKQGGNSNKGELFDAPEFSDDDDDNDDDSDSGDSDDDEPTQQHPARRSTRSLSSSSSSSSSDIRVKVSEGISVADKKANAKHAKNGKKRAAAADDKEEDDESNNPWANALAANPRKAKRVGIAGVKVKMAGGAAPDSDNSGDDGDDGSSGSRKRSAKLLVSQSIDSSCKSRKKRKKNVAAAGADGNVDTEDGSFDLLGNGGSNRQQELVKAAFASENTMADDFAKEKREIVEEGLPVFESAFMPGWGSWGGEGVASQPKTSAKDIKAKKEHDALRKKKAAGRKDANLEHVIISEKTDKKFNNKYLVKSLPHQFTSRQQFERMQRTPLGPDWNTAKSHASMTKPKVLLTPGTIIDPITFNSQINKVKHMQGHGAQKQTKGTLSAMKTKRKQNKGKGGGDQRKSFGSVQ